MSKQLAHLTAIVFYLNELQKHNLITPSIARPYPKTPTDVESLLLHKCYRKIQQHRIEGIKIEIALLKQKYASMCHDTLSNEKKRHTSKIRYLINKFRPEPVKTNARTDRKVTHIKAKHKKSRERYQVRKYKKQLNHYQNNPEDKTVYNLSSTDITMPEMFALEYGHKFVPTSNNPMKEEEMLLLEGLRFIDRIGKVDAALSKRDDENSLLNPKPDGVPLIDFDQNINSQPALFERNKSVPFSLQFGQPKEVDLSNNESKVIKKEFEELNNKLLTTVREKKKRRYNLPKKVRDSLQHLRQLVKDNVIDIRKVDKGQCILIIDYSQRKKTEGKHISEIASLCDIQSSNWMENRQYVENKMKELFLLKFVNKDELTSVTGIIAGGTTGKLKNKDGSMKYTRVISSNELFSKQSTPYVYPSFKGHKLTIAELISIDPNNVHCDIPSRLVVGMRNCQLSRIQAWLEHFLTPLAQLYGNFEYIKDSNDFLFELEKVKCDAINEHWDWEEHILFTIDVKALYPSVKFEYLIKALHHCFAKCTNWSQDVIVVLIEIIMYTLSNQQIYWDGNYYILNKGITTGGKHSVPLANILLTFILLEALECDQFCKMYKNSVKLWKRFIDDCSGIYKGTFEQFLQWYQLLEKLFRKYGLELTYDTDEFAIINQNFVAKKDKKVVFLDFEIYKVNGTLHTKEHRKSTSVSSYLQVSSAHPRHTFPGIVKSQLNRLRRLCSQDSDFEEAVHYLEKRCINSGYDVAMVGEILKGTTNLVRNLKPQRPQDDQSVMNIRLITLNATPYHHEFSKFACRLNKIMKASNIHIDIVKSTSSSIGQHLFNNHDRSKVNDQCVDRNCTVCVNDIQNKIGSISSTVTGNTFNISNTLTCNNGGIYIINGACSGQYTGKTTTSFGTRSNEHFVKSKQTSIYAHKQQCNVCQDTTDFSIAYVENYLNRGKYSLSEREFLWNYRIKGTINIQKTLKK